MMLLHYTENIKKRAHTYLSPKDLIHFNSIPNKKSEWLAGRIAAKKLIKKHFSKLGVALKYKEIEISTKTSGQPYFRNLNLSISHTDKIAIAEISDKGNVGIDIEKIRKIPEIVIEKFLTEKEKNFIALAPKSQNDLYTTLFWSLKESHLKSLGLGLRKHPASVEITKTKKGFYAENKNYLWYKIDKKNNYVITRSILKK